MSHCDRRIFLQRASAGAACLLAHRVVSARGADYQAEPPPFSWDRVPVYAHLGKSDDDFTGEELDFLAAHFDFITIEKGQAFRKRGSTEEGICEAARQLKARNPRMTVLFYWNAFLNYPLYRALDRFRPEWALRDRRGREVLKNGQVGRPDLSLPEVRQWWSDVAAEAVASGPLDGIFADALPQVLAPALTRQVGDDKARAIRDGAESMLRLAREKMGGGKIVLVNGLRGTAYREILDWTGVTGVIIEHFGHFQSAGVDAMLADMESLSLAEAKGKLAVLKGWPGFSWLDSDRMASPREELVKTARERIAFPLACYLVAARPRTWFCYSWGYRESHGMLDRYAELESPLGPPRGEAVWEANTATRRFDHAFVRVDLERKTGEIRWQKA